MNLNIWNCSGAASKPSLRSLKEILQMHKYMILGLLEPKISGTQADTICNKLASTLGFGWKHWVTVEVFGSSRKTKSSIHSYAGYHAGPTSLASFCHLYRPDPYLRGHQWQISIHNTQILTYPGLQSEISTPSSPPMRPRTLES